MTVLLTFSFRPLLPIGLALLAPLAAARPQLYTFEGDSAGDHLGYAVAAAGDVNADGHPDIAVGAPGDDLRKLRLFSGVDGSFLFAVFGRDQADSFAVSIAGAGDLNADGSDDVFALGRLVGPQSYVQAISGGTQQVLFDVDVAGQILAAAGDLNGDGLVDVLVGQSWGPSGQVTALSGLDGSTLWSTDGGFQFGSAIDGVGDVDADGHDDVIVGAHAQSGGGMAESGVVRVLSGLDGSDLYSYHGAGEYEWLGRSVAGVGDVDGDGRPDFAAMADIEFLFILDAPYLSVWSGRDGSLLQQTTFPVTVLTSALDGAGDLNGDGRADVLLAYSALGSPETVLALSGADLSELDRIEPIFERGALASLGDVNGDGLIEVCVGDLEKDPNGLQSGEARVYTHPCLSEPTNYCVGAPNSAGSGAQISWGGTTSLVANDLTLLASGCPVGIFGLFYYGPEAIEIPFGDGNRCVGPGSAGTFRLNPPMLTNGSGGASLSIDNTQPPFAAGPGELTSGSTWMFQFWYRDPFGPGGSGFNLSDGLRVLFCP